MLALWERGGIVLAPEGPAPAAPKEPPHGALLLRLRRWGEPFHLVLWGLAAALCGAGAAGLLPGKDHIYNRAFLPLAERSAGFPHHPLWLSDERPPPNPGGRHRPSAQRAVATTSTTGRTAARETSPPQRALRWVSGPALELWSQRLLENWNLYKAERQRKAPAGKAPPQGWWEVLHRPSWRPRAAGWPSSTRGSTSWKVTKPSAGPGRPVERGKQGMRASRNNKRKTDGRFSQGGCFLSKGLRGRWCPVGRRPARFPPLPCRQARKSSAPTALKSRAAAQTDSAPGPASAAGCPIKEDATSHRTCSRDIFFTGTQRRNTMRAMCHHPRPVRFHPV